MLSLLLPGVIQIHSTVLTNLGLHNCLSQDLLSPSPALVVAQCHTHAAGHLGAQHSIISMCRSSGDWLSGMCTARLQQGNWVHRKPAGRYAQQYCYRMQMEASCAQCVATHHALQLQTQYATKRTSKHAQLQAALC